MIIILSNFLSLNSLLSFSFVGNGKVAMNTDLKEAVKKSSIHFGNEPLDYKSVVRITFLLMDYLL